MKDLVLLEKKEKIEVQKKEVLQEIDRTIKESQKSIGRLDAKSGENLDKRSKKEILTC